MWKKVARILLPAVATAACIYLWVDSTSAVRRLPLLPFGDAALGFKSAAGWLSWDTFWLWDSLNPEGRWISVPYWALVSLGLAFVWRGVARLRNDTRFRWWVWASLGTVTLLLALLQALPDPVDRLRRAVCKPTDEYALYEAYEAVGDVNRAGRGREAAALLGRLLSDDDSSVRKTAVLALARVRADRKFVVSALTRAYEDEKLREPITFALGEIGPADDRVVPALVLALGDPNPRVRGAAASAFFKIGPAGEAAVPALVKALDEKALRLDVLSALEHMGPTAKTAVPALVQLSKTETGYDRLWAAQALWKIDQNTDFVVPALIELLKDPFLPIRVEAARSLGDIGPGARAAVPSLIAVRDYIPQPHPKREAPREREAPQSSEWTPPAPKEMPEDEFYPQVRDAAVAALAKIEAK